MAIVLVPVLQSLGKVLKHILNNNKNVVLNTFSCVFFFIDLVVISQLLLDLYVNSKYELRSAYQSHTQKMMKFMEC